MTAEWDIFTFTSEVGKKKVRDVKNIVGTPHSVQDQVNLHLKNGYTLNSPLLPWKEPNSLKDLFVQQVILFEGDDDDRTSIGRKN